MFRLFTSFLYAFLALEIYGAIAKCKDPVASVCILEDAPTQCGSFCLAALGPLFNNLSTLTIISNETQARLDSIETQLATLLESLAKTILQDSDDKSSRRENQIVLESALQEVPKGHCQIKTIVTQRFELIDLRFFYIEESKLNKQNWTNAVNTCRQMGGHLASITSEDEFNAINFKIDSEYSYWLGIDTQAKNGDYVSVASGTKNSFLKWSEGEPDLTKEFPHCVSVFDKFMYIDECDRKFRFICQADNEV
ncbi:accessory gland protein Acp29AB-like [Drosophila gunungcola]|uniref:accessory gland protein Acp29AB-like n=1 Tax=Drosophila gunungcola TaxID=103775 RepID=UPI0022E3D483|nr:accessory gland protein Acp29AB-like [Drosophila gunungcola]